MASIRKIKTGWRAEVARQGVRRSKVFPTKAEARDWAARVEYEIMNGAKVAGAMPFGDLLRRYAEEVSAGQRGARWALYRIEALCRDPIASVALRDLEPRHFAEWRDRRLRAVKPNTVRREMEHFSATLNRARREWGLIDRNPMEGVRRPKEPPPRDRLPTAQEMDRLALSAGDDLTTATARAFHAFRFGCATAMRAGEIVGLTWDRVDLERRVARLDQTKNGTARDVPLSSEAVALLQALPHADPVFGLTSANLDALWRKLRDRAGVEGLRFHDSRAQGIVALAAQVDVLDLARIVGHRNISMLMVYYRTSAEDLAKKLN